MTVSTTLNRKSYLGDSTTVAFATEFMFLEDTDLDVYLVASDGSATLLTLNTHYTVAGAGSLSGGTVTMVTPPATGERLVLARNIESTQEIDLETTSDMPPASIERMADKLTMLVQQNSTAGQRVLTIPITDSELLSTELPAAASRAGKVLCFDSTGAPKALDIATTETSLIGDGLEIDVNTLKVAADVERTTNKGVADGYAELDSSGLVPETQLSSKVKVSANDTTAGYLEDKITASGATVSTIDNKVNIAVTTPTDATLSMSDVTTNNASATQHGFLPKLPNDASRMLDGTGNWSAPSIANGTVTLDKLKLSAGTWGIVLSDNPVEFWSVLASATNNYWIGMKDENNYHSTALAANAHFPAQYVAYDGVWHGYYTYHSNSEQIIIVAKDSENKIVGVHVTEKGNENALNIGENITYTVKTIETDPDLFTVPVYETLYDKDGKEVQIEVEEGKQCKYTASELMELWK